MSETKKVEEKSESDHLLGVVEPDQATDNFWWRSMFLSAKDCDNLIVRYCCFGRNARFGASYPGLENYFCYKKFKLTVNTLQRRLDTLVKLGLLKEKVVNGTSFFLSSNKKNEEHDDVVED